MVIFRRELLFCFLLFTLTPPCRAFLPIAIQIERSSALLCQLLGMNCAKPTDFSFSLQGFCRRGGSTDIHNHGWGMAFYNGKGVRQFHDTDAAATSPIANFITSLSIQTINMMAHIRYATQGDVELSNVHPFSREMWGIHWCLAHNGDVPLFSNITTKDLPWIGSEPKGDQSYFPVGDTDSEALFCAILNALKAKFDTLPSLPVLHATLQDLMHEVVQYAPQETILNALITCGPHVLWVYSWPGSRHGSSVWNGLHYTVREYPFKKCRLQDLDYEIDFSQVAQEDDRVAVIATKPLTTDEEWIELQRGELILFDAGLPHKSPAACVSVELDGHGLASRQLKKVSLEEDVRRYRFKRSFFTEGAGI
ncbi:glutamine amidotransferase [Fragilaria crotonensis]|nr:glutamine amidotransferase [Fragilaria crotonensis]